MNKLVGAMIVLCCASTAAAGSVPRIEIDIGRECGPEAVYVRGEDIELRIRFLDVEKSGRQFFVRYGGDSTGIYYVDSMPERIVRIFTMFLRSGMSRIEVGWGFPLGQPTVSCEYVVVEPPTPTITPTRAPTPTPTPRQTPSGEALRCQQTIERRGARYALAMLESIDECAATDAASIAACVEAPDKRRQLDALRSWWGRRAATACAGVNWKSQLAYHATCAPPPSECSFATDTIDAPGARNDEIDCLACRTEEHLRTVTEIVLADRPIRNACHDSLARPGLTLLRWTIRQVRRCLGSGRGASIAECLTEDTFVQAAERAEAEWRSSAEAACAGIDPFLELAYRTLCAGEEPVRPPSCPRDAPPCKFESVVSMNEMGENNDLVDCLLCQSQEAALGIARALYGAELCCASDRCDVVESRAACHRRDGSPAYFAIEALDAGAGFNPHGIAAAGDGTIYVADTNADRITFRRPDGTTGVLADVGGAPFGLAVDDAGTVYAALRRVDRVVRITADGTVTPFAGTGTAAHSGDAIPATEASLWSPNGVAADVHGNVYLTESGITRLLLYGVGSVNHEFVRVVDASGVIRTVAGAGLYGIVGAGGPALAASLAAPYQLASVDDGSLLIGEVGAQRVLRIETDGTLTNVAGRAQLAASAVGAYSGDGGAAASARLYGAEGVDTDRFGNVFIADMRNSRIRLVDSRGSIITIAGNGSRATEGPLDGQAGTEVWAGCPGALAIGPDDRVYYPDLSDNRIRVLTRVGY